MYKLNHVFFVFFCYPLLFLNAQEATTNIKIGYELILNTDYPLTKKGELVINTNLNKSIFYEILKNKENEVIEEDSKISVIVSDKNIKFNYADFNDNILVSTESVNYAEYNVTEAIPKFQWKLIDSTEIVGDFECKLATTSYRGRNYFAWYTEKYPLKFGPWKFNGLPGLIVNIYDETKRYIWIMTSLKKDPIPFNEYLKSAENKLDTLTIRDYVQKRYGTDLSSRLKAKLPRNASFVVNNTTRNSKETKFEWEEDKED